MLSRRSLFSLFTGAAAIAAGAKVVEAKPTIQIAELPKYSPERMYPRSGWTMTTTELPSHTHTISDPVHTHTYSNPNLQPAIAPGDFNCVKPCTMARIIPRGIIVSDGSGRLPDLVSLGDGTMIPLDSPEGQAVLRSIAAPNAGMSRW